MQYTTILALLSAIATPALAAPAGAPAVQDTLTLVKFQRTCVASAAHGSFCNFNYSIKVGDDTTPCTYTIDGPVSTVDQRPYTQQCGAYTITSAWNGQFGAGNGFTVLAVHKDNKVAFPSYSDKTLQSGNVVTPDVTVPFTVPN